MSATLRTHCHHSTLRVGLLWLLVVAMVAGSVDLHSLVGDHRETGLANAFLAEVAGGSGSVFVCPTGHTPAAHVEAPRLAETHRCAACLHRLQTRGGEIAAAALPGAKPGAAARWATTFVAAASPFLKHAPSRGPPAA